MNSNLLQKELEVKTYEDLSSRIDWSNPIMFGQLPSYVIARCPICLVSNIERLDTYSIKLWNLRSLGNAVFDSRCTISHCQHFALVQPFFHFHSIWPTEARGMLTPEVPHIIGHLLESHKCQAILHSLPICRIEDGTFVPRYTVFMVSYFSEQPEKAYKAVIRFNVPYVEPGVDWPFIEPPEGYEHWWDLRRWVSTGQLFWVKANDPELGIRTDDIDAFPYGNITGRTWPYLHIFPYPFPKQKR